MQNYTWRCRPRVAVALTLAVTVSTASLAIARAPAAAAAEPPTDVVVVFAHQTPLASLQPVLAATGASVVEWHHKVGEWRGGFYSRGMDLETQAFNYRAAFAKRFDGISPSPFAIRVSESISGVTGALAAAGLPILRAERVPANVTVFVDEPQDGGAVAVAPSAVTATSAGEHPWQPDKGKIALTNNSGVEFRSGNLGLTNEEARSVIQSIIWDHDNVGGLFDPNFAYEHDFKLYNPNNIALPQDADSILCPEFQRGDFWAYKEDGVEWGSTMPDAYLDTGISDKCQYHDLTVGTYHPSQLKRGIDYRVGMTVAQGDIDESPYQLRGETIERKCDIHTFCIGLPGTGRDVGSLLVGIERGVAPGCRTWVPNQSKPCPSFSDDFNRSDRSLGGDNGWQPILGEMQITTNSARWKSYGSDNFGGWYGSATVAQPLFDPLGTAPVSISVDAAVEPGKTGNGTGTLFLFLGGFGTATDFPNEYDDGVYLQVTDSGNIYLEQYNGLSVSQQYMPWTDGIADFRDAPGIVHNFRLDYDPATSTATAFLDGRQILSLVTAGPMGPLMGFASDPEDYHAAQFGEFYFREWMIDNFEST